MKKIILLLLLVLTSTTTVFAIWGDADNDGQQNYLDNCQMVPNADQADADSDVIGDVCDEINDENVDGDGIVNALDNCPFQANVDQIDADSDGIGAECDTDDSAASVDIDGDGIVNNTDNCPFDVNVAQADQDGDHIGDVCDQYVFGDQDGDDVENGTDNCPLDSNPLQLDADNDAIGDTCDIGDIYQPSTIKEIPSVVYDNTATYFFSIDGTGGNAQYLMSSCGDGVDATFSNMTVNPKSQEMTLSNLRTGQTYQCSFVIESDLGVSNSIVVGPFVTKSRIITGYRKPKSEERDLQNKQESSNTTVVNNSTVAKELVTSDTIMPAIYKLGSKGEAVMQIQKKLNQKLGKQLVVDGRYGMQTFNTVKEFQQTNGITIDGIVGNTTLKTLGFVLIN